MKQFSKITVFLLTVTAITFMACSSPFSDSGSGNTSSGGGNQTPPVTYIGTKAPTEAKVVGDIIFSDGSATTYSAELELTDEQKTAVIAVIYKIDAAKPYGVGIRHAKNEPGYDGWIGKGLPWCLLTAKGHYKNITAIQCIPSGEAGNLAFTGDTDGSDNFAKIKEALGNEDDTSNLSNYPAFEFAINYKDKDGSHVKGTAYETGWYLPTVAELYDIHKEIETVDAALKKCGGKTFASPEDNWSTYWSSSQQPLHVECENSDDGDGRAYGLDVVTGAYDETNYKVNNFRYVCCIREF